MTEPTEIREHHQSIFAPFEDQSGISIGGRKIADLAAEVETPFYVYGRDRLDERVTLARDLLPSDVHLNFAVKANPNPQVVKHMSSIVDGFDIASGGELKMLNELNYDSSRVSFAGPGKKNGEIELAIKCGVSIIVESPHQLMQCDRIAAALGRKAQCMVRLNDHRQMGSSGLSMSGSRNAFGWDLSDYLENGIRMFGEFEHVMFHGYHFFYGSQSLQPDVIAEGIHTSAATMRDVPVPGTPRLINLGGGLGIPYGPKDAPLETTSISDALRQAADQIHKRFPDTQICVEFGRYLVGPCGLYVTKVLDKKMSGENQFLVTDGGMHHFSAATGNFGQILKRNHPIWPAKPRSGEMTKKTVVGCLCTPIDVFARDMMLPPVEVGDLIVLFQAGAYGFSASPRGFLSHDEPGEVVV